MRQETAEAAARFVSELVKTHKAMAIYPEGHPARERFYRRLVESFPSHLGSVGAIELEVSRGGIAAGGAPVRTRDGSEVFLAQECFLRQVSRLSFMRGMAQPDFDLFFAFLSTEPEQIRSRGGAVQFMRGRGTGALRVEQVDYSGILERREAADGSDGSSYRAEVLSPVAPPEPESPQGQPAPRVFEDESGREEVSQEEWLRAKLAELDAAGSPPVYRQVLRDIFTSLRSTGALKIPEYSMMVIRHLGGHLRLKAPEEIIRLVRASVRELASPPVVAELAAMVAKKDVKDRQNLEAILDEVPERSIPALLLRLAEESEAFGRKTIMNILVRWGQEIRPHLQNSLADERWYVVRNALALLGQVGSEGDAQLAMGYLTHPNSKVRLEALRLLSRFPAPLQETAMETLLGDGDAEVRARAVYALGVLRGEQGLARLMELAQKPFYGQGDVSMRELAIRGLGREGGERAVAFLKKLMRRTAIVDRAAFSRIQKAAVEALVEIGGARAQMALRERLGSLRGEARRAAEDFLRRAERSGA